MIILVQPKPFDQAVGSGYGRERRVEIERLTVDRSQQADQADLRECQSHTYRGGTGKFTEAGQMLP